MLIRGSHIRNLERHMRGVLRGTRVIVALTDPAAHGEALRRAGLSLDMAVGETRLPAAAGKVSTYNAEGDEVVHKDQPMETVFRQQLWTWEEWRGRYDTETQWKIVDVPYQRYPRTFRPPPSIELTAVELGGGRRAFITDPVIYDATHEEELLHRVNLLLELFRECEVLDDRLVPFSRTNLRRVNWTILPAGEVPWPQLRERLEPILRQMGERIRPVYEERLKLLTQEFIPDFAAVGLGGFYGYLVFGYKEKDLYVLESLTYGNATYVFGQDWEELSKLTKREILVGGLQRERIIHREGWARQMRALLR